jgi:hypothetical protein
MVTVPPESIISGIDILFFAAARGNLTRRDTGRANVSDLEDRADTDSRAVQQLPYLASRDFQPLSCVGRTHQAQDRFQEVALGGGRVGAMGCAGLSAIRGMQRDDRGCSMAPVLQSATSLAFALRKGADPEDAALPKRVTCIDRVQRTTPFIRGDQRLTLRGTREPPDLEESCRG